MKLQPSYWAIIPANVRYDKRLKANEKLLYGEISSLSDKFGYCFATNKYFAELYDVTNTSISLWIKNLIDCGYIKSIIIYREGTKEILERHLSLVFLPPQDLLKAPIQDKLIVNNTSNNNTSISSTNLFSESEVEDIPTQVLKYLNEKKGGRGYDINPANLTPIKARLKEKYTLEDCKKVIDASIVKWLDDTEMKKYIRPETLFQAKKFNGYLIEADDVIKNAKKLGSTNFEYNPTDTAEFK